MWDSWTWHFQENDHNCTDSCVGHKDNEKEDIIWIQITFGLIVQYPSKEAEYVGF